MYASISTSNCRNFSAKSNQMNTSLKNQKLKELLKLKEIDLCQNILSNASEEDLSNALFLQLANETERVLGNREKALAYAQLLQKKFPTRPVGHAKVAQDLLTLGYLEQAIQTVEEIIRSHPENQLLLQVAAQAHRKNGNLLKALQYSRALIKVSPERLIGFHYTSKDLLKLNKFTECIHTTRDGLDKHKGDLYLLQLGIEAARAKKDIDQVLDLSNQLKIFHPEDPSGFTCSAQSYLQNQNLNQALHTTYEGLTRHPKNPLLLQLGIESARSLGETSQSLAFGERLLSILPNEATAYCTTAKDLIDLSRADEALVRIKAGLEKQPGNIQLIQAGIEASRSLGKTSQSLAFGERLLSILPNEATAYCTTAKDLIDLSRADEALVRIKAGLEKQPGNIQLIQAGIEASRSNDNHKSAVEYGKALISLLPNEYHGYLNISRDLTELGNLKDAEKIITKLQRIHPNTPEPICHARDFYRRIGNRKKSLALSTRMCNRFGKTDLNLLEEASDLIALGHLKDSRLTKLPSTVCDRTQIESTIKFLLEEKTHSVIPPNTRSTLSALKVYSHFNKDFNPIHIDTGSLQEQIVICVIHIGKCAGESILNTLQKNITKKNTRIIEFHIFDADMILPAFFHTTLQCTNIHWIILTRDPLTRWISAFNWDKHIFSINSHLYCHAHFKHLMQKYKNAKKLIKDLIRNKEAAFELSSFHHLACGHMQMGQAWYLERFPIDKLSTSQTSVIRTEHIAYDYERCIHDLENRFPCLKTNYKTDIDRTKSNYQNCYRHDRFTKVNDLTIDEINFMKNFLSNDYTYHNQIIQKYLATNS